MVNKFKFSEASGLFKKYIWFDPIYDIMSTHENECDISYDDITSWLKVNNITYIDGYRSNKNVFTIKIDLDNKYNIDSIFKDNNRILFSYKFMQLYGVYCVGGDAIIEIHHNDGWIPSANTFDVFLKGLNFSNKDVESRDIILGSLIEDNKNIPINLFKQLHSIFSLSIFSGGVFRDKYVSDIGVDKMKFLLDIYEFIKKHNTLSNKQISAAKRVLYGYEKIC